ncbi:MAG: TetR/AcrR family transcriptional regulator [Thermodesulfobacteriota bacterium]
MMGTKGEATKDKLIKTARHLFKHQGYKNTTIDDICKAAGVKRGNLYFYFESKEDLAYSVVDRAIEKEFPFLNRIMGELSDPLMKIEAMIDGMAMYVIDRNCQGG